MKKSLWILATLAAGATAHGQLALITNTGTAGLARAMYYDLGTQTTTTLWTTTGTTNNGYGIAADDSTGRLYYDTGARIAYANYGTAPMTSGQGALGHYYSDASTVAQGWDLTMANGNLYAWDKGSTTFVRGIYQVNTTPVGTKYIESQVWADSPTTGNQYEFQGLTYRAQSGLFYGVNTITDHALGLYTINAFGNGAVNFIASLPGTHTHVDGLTINSAGTTMYMTEQTPSTSSTSHDGFISIFSYDIATATYGTTYTIAYDDTSQRGTGITWAPNIFNPVPEPTSIAALGFGVLILIRRRKRS